MDNERITIIKHNDGDWEVRTSIDEDMLDNGTLPEWYEDAKVMIVNFKPTHKLVGPETVQIKLVKL